MVMSGRGLYIDLYAIIFFLIKAERNLDQPVWSAVSFSKAVNLNTLLNDIKTERLKRNDSTT